MNLSDVGEHGQLKLKHASVLCVGAGGLGSGFLPYLAAAGIGRIGIIDHDIIELSNLQRQVMYKTSDLGRKKVAAAKDFLQGLNPDIIIDIYPVPLNAQNSLDIMCKYDIAADCTDNLTSRLHLNTACLRLDKPFVFAGISQFHGQCMLFRGRRGPCFACVFPDISQFDLLPDCNAAGVMGVVPGVLGVFQANLILQNILGLQTSDARLFVMDMLEMKLRDYRVEKNPQCCVCGEGVSLRVASDLHHISAAELQIKLNNREHFTLLDVRTLAEHQMQHLDGICIPLDELPQRSSELNPAIPVIVYCQSGKRSMTAARLLYERNFQSVAYLDGGIVSCQACGMI